MKLQAVDLRVCEWIMQDGYRIVQEGKWEQKLASDADIDFANCESDVAQSVARLVEHALLKQAKWTMIRFNDLWVRDSSEISPVHKESAERKEIEVLTLDVAKYRQLISDSAQSAADKPYFVR